MPKVVVTRPFDRSVLDPFCNSPGLEVTVLEDGEARVPGKLEAAVDEAHGLLCMISETVDERLLEHALQLKVVSNMAVGYDNIDVEAATERGVLVCNTPDVLTETTAELAIALMFAAARRIVEADRYVRIGNWQRWEPGRLLGRDLFGSTLGIVGAGRIGSAVARRGRGLGMNVLYASRSANAQIEENLGAERVDMDALFATADIVSLHAPLTVETRALVDERRLSMMKRDAILVNTSRGALVNEGDLARALQEGELLAAGLDVFENEPRVEASLLALDNVVLSPHIGSASVATRRRMAEVAVGNIVSFFSGQEPQFAVNACSLAR